MFDHIRTLSYINQSRIGTYGHSRGGLTSLLLSNYYPDDIAATVSIAGPDWGVLFNTSRPRNVLLCAGLQDTNVEVYEMREILSRFTGGFTQEDMLYGDFSDGTARKLIISNSQHNTMIFQRDVLTEMITWFEMAFYGSLTGPISLSFETNLGLMIVSATLGVISVLWGFFALQQLFFKAKLLKRVTTRDSRKVTLTLEEFKELNNLKRKKNPYDFTRPFIIAGIGAGAGGLSAAIVGLLPWTLLDYDIFFGLLSQVPFTFYVDQLELLFIIQLASLGLVLVLWLIERFLGKKTSLLERNEVKLELKGKWFTSAGLGVLFFLLLYLALSWSFSTLLDLSISRYRMTMFVAILPVILASNAICSLITFGMIQSRFKTKRFSDTWACLIIGMLFRGAIVAILYLSNVMTEPSLLLFAGFYVGNLAISVLSFHYLKSRTQETIFSSFFISWLLAWYGNFFI
ncbi:MAG: alpha/beta hydrolase family protein [Candidatus Hodarchaeota archaeon]